MVLVIGGGIGREADLVGGATIFYDAVEFGGDVAGAAKGAASSGFGEIAIFVCNGMKILLHARRLTTGLHARVGVAYTSKFR